MTRQKQCIVQQKGKTTNNGFHTDAKTWDYYEKTIKSDGKYYDVLINVKDTGNEQYVYDITLKETSPPHRTNLSSRGELVSNVIITPSEQNASGNTQFSLSENDNISHNPNLTYGSDIGYDPSTETLWPINDGYDLGPVREDVDVFTPDEDLGPVREVTPMTPDDLGLNDPPKIVHRSTQKPCSGDR